MKGNTIPEPSYSAQAIAGVFAVGLCRVCRSVEMFKKFIGWSPAVVEYVGTRQGIFTETGTWFSVTEEAVEQYAAEVLRVRPLGRLLADADVWLRGPLIVALWSLIVFLLLLPPFVALAAAITMYAGWSVVGPSFVSRFASKILRVADAVFLQAIAYTAVLSALARTDALTAVWVGLGGFILFRWGLIQRLIDPLLRPIHRSLYDLPLPDQVLRAFIVRVALKHRIDIPHIQEIERGIREKW